MSFSQLKDKYINACLVGDINTVEYMVKRESKKIKNNYFFAACLNSACKGTNDSNSTNIIDIVKIIIKYIKVYPGDACRFLYSAFKSGNIEIIEIVKNIPNINGYHVYHGLTGACRAGRMDIFMKYEDIMLNNIDIKKMSYQTIWDNYMSYACKSGNIQLVNYFINKGASNWNDGLKCACSKGHIEIVELMILKGANCWDKGLQSACYNHNKNIMQIVELMISKGATDWDNCMYTACANNQMQIVKLIIEKGSVTDWNTYMYAPCSHGYIDIIEFMISKGANNWNEGLGYACIGNNVEMVKFMISKGATNFDNYFRYPYIGNLTIAQILIDHGADDWNNGLISSCLLGDDALVKLMLKHEPTNLNECLIINQNCHNNADISNMLINKGADYLESLKDTENFKLYQMYSMHIGTTNVKKFMKLFLQYPPYVLLIGSRCKGKRGNKCFTKRLPIELFKLLVQY